jgi:hypothetical protein
MSIADPLDSDIGHEESAVTSFALMKRCVMGKPGGRVGAIPSRL